MGDAPISVVCITSGLLLASAVLWGIGFRRWMRGMPLLEPVSQPVGQVHLAALVITLGGILPSLLAAFVAPTRGNSEVSLEAIQFDCFYRTMIGLGVLLPLVTNPNAVVEHLGFHLTNWLRQLRDGCQVFLLSVGPVMVVWWLSLAFRDSQTLHPLLRFLAQDSSIKPLAWVCIAAAVVAPIYEELLYRVVLQSSLGSVLSSGRAVLITAFIFAAVHRLPDSLPLLPLAMLLGYLFQQRRSFAAVVVTHSLFNATNLLFAWLS